MSFLEIRCKLPTQFANGKYKMRNRVLPSSGTSVKVGSRLVFTCNTGFYMDGQRSLECLEDGTWSDLIPICQPAPCSEPPM